LTTMNPRGPDLLEVSLVAVILALIVYRLTLA
jgi:hypothetical protein